MAAMFHDIVIICHHCKVPVPGSHTVSHVDQEERVAWFYISMHACGFVPIAMVLLFVEALLLKPNKNITVFFAI